MLLAPRSAQSHANCVLRNAHGLASMKESAASLVLGLATAYHAISAVPGISHADIDAQAFVVRFALKHSAKSVVQRVVLNLMGPRKSSIPKLISTKIQSYFWAVAISSPSGT